MNIDTGASIGAVDPVAVLAEVRRWRGSEYETTSDLSPWSHPQLRAATVARARQAGGVVVSSGGTTGTPKLTVMAPDLGVPKVLRHWRPLRPGDVLVNLFSTGRMWGAQYFYNAVATRSRCTVAPMGSLGPEDLAEWADELEAMGVSALAGAPNVLARFADMIRSSRVDLPVRTIIWSGEPMTPARLSSIRATFPAAGLWGNYGSIETFVIGVSRPECDLGAIHLLPGQVLEPDDDGALLTRVGDGWPAPAVRFRLGDRVRPVVCTCGRGDGFAVIGRADDRVKIYGAMVRAGQVMDKVRAVDRVDDAQLVIYGDPDVPSAIVGLRVLVTGRDVDPAEVRRAVVRGVEGIKIIDGHSPEAFVVDHVPDLERSPNTNKVLPVVRQPARSLAEMQGVAPWTR